MCTVDQSSLNRVFNFYPGPGAIPFPVLERAHQEFFNFKNTGMSVMELSHRSTQIQDIIDDGVERIKRLMSLKDEFEVVFLQGGGSLQFLMVPMNFCGDGDCIDYVDTGYWAEKAIKGARSLNRDLDIVASSADKNYNYVPDLSQIKFRESARYLHLCSNNTVVGTQFNQFPKLSIPVVVDMSSDFMSKVIDTRNLSVIYAHAQKNVGLSGVTVVLIRKQMLAEIANQIPEFLDYRTHVEKKSNYHTPPCFSIYITWHILRWIEEDIGGLVELEKINSQKANLIYECLDYHTLYNCPTEKKSRSQMNAVFTLPTEELTKQFINEASNAGLVGVAGHRTRGGCRVSLYNGVSLKAVEKLVSFMEKFAEKELRTRKNL